MNDSISRATALMQYVRIMKRFSESEQTNIVSAIRSIYCCRVLPWSLARYDKCLHKMTSEEQRAVIDYVMAFWPD